MPPMESLVALVGVRMCADWRARGGEEGYVDPTIVRRGTHHSAEHRPAPPADMLTMNTRHREAHTLGAATEQRARLRRMTAS